MTIVRPGRAVVWLFWVVVLAAVTAAMFSVRGQLDQAHVALIYLLIVLGGSASGGRLLGISLACTCFLLIDYYLQTPYDTLWVDKAPDWIVLLAFLVTAAVAAELLGRATAQAEAARMRAVEIDRLASLGAETLNVGRAEDALAAIAKVTRETIGAGRCDLYAYDGARCTRVATAAGGDDPGAAMDDDPRVARVAESRGVGGERTDGSVFATSESRETSPALDREVAAVRTLLLPLLVHGRCVGVLRLADRDAIALDPTRRRFVDAIAYYAALGIERSRLVAEIEHAEALREADRLKDALLASVSHDLRTPLTTIKALAHDIAESGDERASAIEKESDRLNQMVADLLDLSRLNAGGFSVKAEINTAEDLIGAAIQRVAGALGSREIRAKIEMWGPVPVGTFDFVHSLRILANLIENAIKYSPADTPIDIEVTRAGAMLAIAVLDRGRGVPPGERERIFEPFYRPAGVPPDIAGSGLGLAIARRLAEAQGGSLAYADRSGGGSAFTLCLPAPAGGIFTSS